MISRLKEIIEYKDMIYSMVKRELRGRYQKSALGMLWALLFPLFQIAIYTFVFGVIFPSSIENYYIYLTAGIVPWTFFSEAVGQGAGCIVNNSNLATKIYFPREVLPISAVLAKFINMLLAFVIVFLFIVIGGVGINPAAIWFLPIVMIAEFILCLGFTLLFSAITVYIRDMEYIVGILMMAWIWGTPIMYSMDNLQPIVKVILLCNPMTSIVQSYHAVLYYKQLPDTLYTAITWGSAIIILVIGELVFAHLEGDFAEEM
ncbi:ABC transporter permease [Butyrivibrio sp. MB2005]|uniref:ABC transporter permease n=1 Tax=Butyrivibrio sp. MB2005 TaxID=1280678 RepID=UPI00041499E6|nr:ABC transporter permease [Butyrivibrio sp. MB2005]